jgi:hypothetical protein
MPTINPSPKNANGFDFGEGVFVFANNKLVVSSKGAREHITVHFGPASQTLDIHKTSATTGGSAARVTLFAISHANLLAMMQEIAPPLMETLRGVARPLHPAQMVKEQMGAIVGLLPTGDNLAAVTKIHRRKLSVDTAKLAAQSWAPEFLDELYDLGEGEIFTVFTCKFPRKVRKIGFGFPVSYRTGHRRLVWIPDKRVVDAIARANTLIQKAAARHGTFYEPLPWDLKKPGA